MLILAVLSPLSGKVKIMMNRSIADGAPRLLFDYQVVQEKKVTTNKCTFKIVSFFLKRSTSSILIFLTDVNRAWHYFKWKV